MNSNLIVILAVISLLVLVAVVVVAIVLFRKVQAQQLHGTSTTMLRGGPTSKDRASRREPSSTGPLSVAGLAPRSWPQQASPPDPLAQDSELDQAHSAEAASERTAAQGLTTAQAETVMASAEMARSEGDLEVRTQRKELSERRADVERREQRLSEREERLDSDLHSLEERSAQLRESKNSIRAQRKSLVELESQHQVTLERIAGLTAEEAKLELIAAVEHDAKRHAVIVARDIERTAVRTAEAQAQTILVGAIQRIASEQTSESVVSAVHLPGDEMKGRIIGREGRNIRAFEQVTGVNVMIDDTPESVLLSCFDPVRRATAILTLTELVKDGRIHPARIEEMHERSKAAIEAQCLRAAEDAMTEVGISDLHPALISVLGTLRYRTSYGQNVLKHLVESANIAGLMAAEIGLDIAQCKRAAFLHDIGKALTHEVEGSHAIIGADLARKYGENADIVHAIEAHHNEVEPRTVEAVLVQAADAVSGSRPGARRESVEAYVQRLEKLEEIARSKEGVDKVFAMQAGREIRVMVAPDVVDDIEAQVLARDIVKQIEEELTYPGQIKVTVVRESRATETAR